MSVNPTFLSTFFCFFYQHVHSRWNS